MDTLDVDQLYIHQNVTGMMDQVLCEKILHLHEPTIYRAAHRPLQVLPENGHLAVRWSGRSMLARLIRQYFWKLGHNIIRYAVEAAKIKFDDFTTSQRFSRRRLRVIRSRVAGEGPGLLLLCLPYLLTPIHPTLYIQRLR
jgi:hypothetical protein